MGSQIPQAFRKSICLSLFVSLLCTHLAGCSLSDLVTGNPLPADAQDPNAVKTPAGALGAYHGALVALAIAGRIVVQESGLLTDELQSALSRRTVAVFPDYQEAVIDARNIEEWGTRGVSNAHSELQKVRAQAREAAGALRKYHPMAPSALMGHLVAIEGMAEVLLAELYCSGIPLSTLDFEGDYTLKPGSRSEEVYQHALVLFDSVLSLAADSARFVHLANVGRARALLALADYAGAARAVENVPTSYTYQLSYSSNGFKYQNGFQTAVSIAVPSVGDREGGTGLPFRSSDDPRTLSDSILGEGIAGGIGYLDLWVPRKYLPAEAVADGNPGTVPIVLASGIEARLIEAEAALSVNSARWLGILNALRTTCTTDTDCPIPAPAGTGGVAGLSLLADLDLGSLPPGKTIHDVRVDLLFQERAYWLFLTGHRQGDLRRLIRQYKRDPSTVYPVGPWGVRPLVSFGTDVNLPVPIQEQQTNPLYRGCFNREA